MAPSLRTLALVGGLLLGRQGHGLYDPVHRLESARLYGNIDAYAYYYVHILVGTPPQRVSVIIDTGSGVAAFPCAGCRHCGQHIDPAFDFSKSPTAKWVGCGAGCAGQCKENKCGYHQGYTEGSSISGFWFSDKVRLGDAIQQNPPVTVRMGCHNNENRLFYTQKANGILGIGPAARAGGRTLLQELYQDKAHVNAETFAMCLAEWGGRLVVGGFNESCHRGPMQYIPMSATTGYYVSLTTMRIGDNVIKQNFGSAMIDSGTTYTYMGSGPYNALKDGIVNFCRNHAMCGAQLRGTCWILPGVASLSSFPNVEVSFGAVSITWLPKGYLYRKGNPATWCFSFQNDGPHANTVLGASFMLHKDVVFEVGNKRVGIAQADCPEYRERPKHNPAILEPGHNLLLQPAAPVVTSNATAQSPRPGVIAPAGTSTPTPQATTAAAAHHHGVVATVHVRGNATTVEAAAPGHQQAAAELHPLRAAPVASAANGTSWRVPAGVEAALVPLGIHVSALVLVAIAGSVVGCTCLGVCLLCRRCCKPVHRHQPVETEERAPGVAPTIIGAAVAEPATFVIDDEDEDVEFEDKPQE